MEKAPEAVPVGSNYLNLRKSFQQGTLSLLTALPFEDFFTAFPRFTGAEQGRLYRLYIEAITSLHENMQDELDSICHETQEFPHSHTGEKANLKNLQHKRTTVIPLLQRQLGVMLPFYEVGYIMNKVEHLVELQTLDPLFAEKTNLDHVKCDLLAAKKNEIQLLEGLLDKVEEQKLHIKARIELLKKKSEGASGTRTTMDTLKKFNSAMINYGNYGEI